VDSFQRGDFEVAKSMLADDFQFSGFIPEPINKETWLGMSASLQTALANWRPSLLCNHLSVHVVSS
jgi:hypothetical protein